jgi:hypothetical protein
MVASVVVFAGLALVALALGLLARAYSRAALAAGLAGLLGVTASVTWTSLAAPVPAKPVVENSPIPAPGPSEPPPSAMPPTASVPGNTDGSETTGQGASLRTGRVTATPEVIPYIQNLNRSKLVGALVATAKLKVENSRLKRALWPKSEPLPTLEELRKHLAARWDTQLLPDKQLVAGQGGSWYRISPRVFKNWAAEQPLRSAIRQLQQEILGPLVRHAPGLESKLYVRGTADLTNVVNLTDIMETPVHRFTDVQRKQYIRDHSPSPVDVKVPNEALPNLRAAWMRDQIAIALADQVHKHPDIGLLENFPAGDKRTVDLILYVKW